jgi:hypothetical protein
MPPGDKMTRTATVCWILLLSIAAALPAVAQPSVELDLSNKQLYVGEGVDITLSIKNYRQSAAEPIVPATPGARITPTAGRSESSFVQIIGGRRTATRTVTYGYELVPQQVGELTIPPFTVVVDGVEMQTPPQTATVRPSNAHEIFIVEITTEEPQLYVGQRAALTMTIWVRPPPYGGQRLPPEYCLRRIEPIDFGPFPPQISNPENVARERVIDGQSRMFYAFDFEANTLLERPGPLTFDEILVGMQYPTSRGVRNLRVGVTGPPIEVLPVPQQGRPASFNGAVGLFRIDTAAAPTAVRVGDPIQLTIEIYGDGAVDALPPPLLDANTELAQNFRLPDQPLTGTFEDFRRRFTLTIRAQRDDVTRIPSIEYPYFDPGAQRFVVARSAAIPLNVAPAAEVVTPDIGGGHRNGSADGNDALTPLSGLRDIETRPERLLAQHTLPSPRLVATTMLVPPFIFALLWGLQAVAARNRDPALRRRTSATRTARQRIRTAANLPPAEAGSAIVTALAGYLADRAGQPPGRFVGAAGVQHLRDHGVPAEVIDRWTRVTEACEAASFAGQASADPQQTADEARACLAALERTKL